MDAHEDIVATTTADLKDDDQEANPPKSCCQKTSAKETAKDGVVNKAFVDVDKVSGSKLQEQGNSVKSDDVVVYDAAIRRPENGEQAEMAMDLELLGPCQCEQVGHRCQCKSASNRDSSGATKSIRFESWGRWKCWALSITVALTCIWLVVYFSLHYNNLL